MSPSTLYQIVHTLDGNIYHLEEHLSLLFEAYFELHSGCAKLPQEELRRQIEEVIRDSRCPRGVSLFVKISISSEGKVSVEEYERSLYQGYTLRCISPRAALVEYNIPHISLPTHLREQLTQFANSEARKRRGDLALRLSAGEVDLINGAQIFALKGELLLTAQLSYSVEHALAKECALRLGLDLCERPIDASELPHLDELFFVDHYGVTAIRNYAERYYMSLTASAIASALALAVG
ncbi:MAG: aminotransferase class IV [Rikenellaceae bacterium]